jgi:hypothetical protein
MRARRDAASRSTLRTIVIALVAAGAALGQAPRAAAQGATGFASIEDKADWLRGGAPRRAGGGPSYQVTSHFGLFVDVLDLGGLELQFDEAEVAALGGARLDAAELGARTTGGVSLGVGGRLVRWVRLPELLFSIGGGTVDGRWQQLGGQAAGLEVRATSLFLFRVELAAGIQIPLRHVRPYALGRLAGAYYAVGAEVRHASLGGLGSESVGDWALELGTEVGVAISIGDGLELDIGWRACWYGTPGHGVTLTLVGGRRLR